MKQLTGKYIPAKTLFILLAICASAIGYAQEIRPEEKLALSDTLLFMGMDFSQARMVSPEDILSASFISHKHGDSWCATDDRICANSNLGFDFHKKNVTCHMAMFDSSYLRLDSTWIVAKYIGISTDQIARHVRSYPHISGYKLGIAFIIDKMDKKAGVLTMYAVYIDLRDNSALKIIKCAGMGEGFGYSMFWGHAITDAYEHFVSSNHNYLESLKHYFKKHP